MRVCTRLPLCRPLPQAGEVINFVEHVSSGFYGDLGRCTPGGGEHDCTKRYMCVRITWNGQHMHQLCDPGDERGRITGVVRAAVEELWNDLRRAHFLDAQSRALSITLQVAVSSP